MALRGKYHFGCKIIAKKKWWRWKIHPLISNMQSGVGISRNDYTVENLGETEHSFGFTNNRYKYQ